MGYSLLERSSKLKYIKLRAYLQNVLLILAIITSVKYLEHFIKRLIHDFINVIKEYLWIDTQLFQAIMFYNSVKLIFVNQTNTYTTTLKHFFYIEYIFGWVKYRLPIRIIRLNRLKLQSINVVDIPRFSWHVVEIPTLFQTHKKLWNPI